MITTDIVSHEGDKDKDVPQWVEFTFEKKRRKVVLPKVTLQREITEEPRKVKKPKTMHHLLRTGLVKWLRMWQFHYKLKVKPPRSTKYLR